jgi:beta-phosphoglucomutase
MAGDPMTEYGGGFGAGAGTPIGNAMRRGALEQFISRYTALLFDLDGTLVDTMPLHYRAYAEVFTQRGLRLSEADFMARIGEPARKAIPRFLEAAGVSAASAEDVGAIHSQKKQAFERYLSSVRLVPLPAVALLDTARNRKKLGLVTSGNRAGVTSLISAMGWENVFDVIISGDEVSRGKPEPEPYLAAALSLGVDPKECLVLEDTEAGLAAGVAAGMSVLDVTELTIIE